jgi:hypothetical protein
LLSLVHSATLGLYLRLDDEYACSNPLLYGMRWIALWHVTLRAWSAYCWSHLESTFAKALQDIEIYQVHMNGVEPAACGLIEATCLCLCEYIISQGPNCLDETPSL